MLSFFVFTTKKKEEPTRLHKKQEETIHIVLIVVSMQNRNSLIETLVPDRRKRSIRNQLASDIKHMEEGYVNCILFDYMELDVGLWLKYYKKEESKHLPYSILQIEFMQNMEESNTSFYYLIHMQKLRNQLKDFKKKLKETKFVNVDPKLSEPCLIDSYSIEYQSLLNSLQYLNRSIESTQPENGIYRIDLSHAVTDTCLLNGWLLDYPYIYVHTHLSIEKETCFHNCLSMVPLQLFKILAPSGSVIRQFTVPTSILVTSDVKELISKQEHKYQKCSIQCSTVQKISIAL